MICEYGCERKAHFQTKNGRWCCEKSPNSCPEMRRKNSHAISKLHEEHPEKYFHLTNGNHYGFANKEWREQHPEMYKKAGSTYSKKLKSGEIIHPWKGRKHSIETREKISQHSYGGKDGFVKTKYYDIYCPYEKKSVKVQGTWELKYCLYLNEKNVNWIRSRKYNLRFRYDENDIKRTYFPDIYLPDTDEYVEIKGYMSEHDILKMQKVVEHNKDKKITVLKQKDLESLGIVLY